MKEQHDVNKVYDVIIVGGGQSGLALAYYLRRTGLRYVILDAGTASGGSWQNYWSSITLFSPAQWSSLPGTLMPGGTEHYPGKGDITDYLTSYEKRYELKIDRPVRVTEINWHQDIFTLQTSVGTYQARVVVGATGSFENPFIPEISGRETFTGKIIHSAQYRESTVFKNQKVGIVGEGNSGAQILSEVSRVADTFWITKDPPDFLPDHVDGRYLFDAASQLFEAKKRGREYIPPSLGHIVMVPSVKDARSRSVLVHYPSITRFTTNGVELEDHRELPLDSVIFCTGFRPALQIFKNLPVTFRHDKIPTNGTRSRELPGLWMVGYGSWTGFASATVVGVGRSAKATSIEIEEFLK
ncbi:ArsO family NAD(P)H-dependent flavin-containing monooxygenase [Marinoscillum sp. 108]|uniref:ArsO family NAD(P)H-dependent flavin-containing monooxygenase n=1 Tax=Marinoscillum sp. 108 TaxID=2653151 RepID=UPI0012F02124|nr:ArsO family NAD(P)H-dependent flavin-containing monooxygenase [Marinoscillum sp. 108]VXD17533.1 Pyridine nucleotide-disulfide oxidoreductase [Marinoscillum sp. 108]